MPHLFFSNYVTLTNLRFLNPQWGQLWDPGRYLEVIKYHIMLFWAFADPPPSHTILTFGLTPPLITHDSFRRD